MTVELGWAWSPRTLVRQCFKWAENSYMGVLKVAEHENDGVKAPQDTKGTVELRRASSPETLVRKCLHKLKIYFWGIRGSLSTKMTTKNCEEQESSGENRLQGFLREHVSNDLTIYYCGIKMSLNTKIDSKVSKEK